MKTVVCISNCDCDFMWRYMYMFYIWNGRLFLIQVRNGHFANWTAMPECLFIYKSQGVANYVFISFDKKPDKFLNFFRFRKKKKF